ncbi:MAG TPA: WhiB family transcriptional regulator [Spirillospora sp.]|nr:WhiB family transcriptional regulator [Spirillospora sp.]
MIGRVPEWTRQARCTGLVTRGLDLWCPDEELTRTERRRQVEQAKAICATCPVLLDCAAEALANLDKAEEHTVRAGMTPTELRAVAARLGMPTRREAQHGTNSRYASSGCRCELCTAAHAAYEHQRRLWKAAGRDEEGAVA